MLKLIVAMSRFICLLALFLLLGLPIQAVFGQIAEGTATPTVTPTPTPAIVLVSSPVPGQALQGNVTVSGNTAVQGFQSGELSFAYPNSSTGTWFLIQESSEPVANSTLALWDTTTITDGVYDLRLVVTLQDGSQKTFIVPGVRVRNYTPIETNTATPVTPTSTPLPGDTPVPSETPTPTVSPIPPTSTALPANPAEISQGDVRQSLLKGGLAAVGIFALIGIYRGLKRLGKHE